MRVLVLGSGGREHALCWAIGRSPLVSQVVCAPGNDGMRGDARLAPVDLTDLPSVVKLALEESADLVVVGPEDPLAAGVADVLREAGIVVFGPGREAAQLESSKLFAKQFMERHGIPTAGHRVFEDADAAEAWVGERGGDCVVKADGLAAGKGVFVCTDVDAARAAVDEIMRDRRFGASGARVVIEERLVGEEISYYAICDGERWVPLGSAQDFKRALDGDRGENTGGMGAYSPVPFVDAALERRIHEQILDPVFSGMRAEGRPYRGVLFAGLILVDGDPVVIEFNCRFGDPETQALLFRLESDLVPVLEAAAEGRLPDDLEFRYGDPSVAVVIASEGYPRSYPKGVPIEGLDAVEGPDLKCFHAASRLQGGALVTNGGRVLCATARGASLEAARDRAYAAAERIAWPGAQYRRDIALRALRSDETPA
ncbi:MAG: phosphoribosylamine--glycine ligase [Deltaproteobacteria bacterium]|nr:phosphoribosylamine--glycine ligase [Deltaproteobacteria bacterium]